MESKKSARATTVTRRVVLSGGIGCALTLAIPKLVLGSERLPDSAMLPLSNEHSALYVFPGKKEGSTVIAATCASSGASGSVLQIHTNGREGLVRAPFDLSRPALTSVDDVKIFVGQIVPPMASPIARLNAVVIEAPSVAICFEGRADIWAEQIFPDGSRTRIGSPFFSNLSSRHTDIAAIYHRSSPAQDKEGLQLVVAQTISENVRKHGYAGNPSRYGERVAAAITPDTLRYDSRMPVGFTFAAQNGRHPNDDAQAVVDSVINGVLEPASTRRAYTLQRDFPYFQRSAVAA